MNGDLVRPVEENLWSMWAQFGRGEGCVLVDEPDLLRFETPLAKIPYNSVFRFRGTDDVDGQVDDIVTGYEQRGVPMMWVVHPTAQPADLPTKLKARGLEDAETVLGMARALDDLPPNDTLADGVTIDEVTMSDCDDFIDLVSWRYDLEPMDAPALHSVMAAARFGEPGTASRGLIARREGQSLSKIVVHFGAGVAGIYGVATRSEARGLGLARHLTVRALEIARDGGADLCVLHSTPMAVSLYSGVGFEPVADLVLYSTPGTLHL